MKVTVTLHIDDTTTISVTRDDPAFAPARLHPTSKTLMGLVRGAADEAIDRAFELRLLEDKPNV